MTRRPKEKWKTLALTLTIMLIAANPLPAAETPVSGRLVDGFRVLTIADQIEPLHWTVYRGDYIKIAWPSSDGQALLHIPDLGIQQALSGDNRSAPYFKMIQKPAVLNSPLATGKVSFRWWIFAPPTTGR